MDWDHELMLQRYLYDYLIKKGMYGTAEIFRQEANLAFDPAAPPTIDTPHGFLLEWWSIFYDMFTARYTGNLVNNDCSSYVGEQTINVGQQGDSSTSREQEINEQMIRELTESSDFGLTAGENLMLMMDCDLVKTEQNSQGSSSPQPQQKPLTFSNTLYHPGNFGNVVAQGVGPSFSATPNSEKSAPSERVNQMHPGSESHMLSSSWLTDQSKNKISESPSIESERKRRNSACSEVGSNSVPRATGCPSKNSSPIYESLKDIVQFPALLAYDVNDEEMISSSNSPRNDKTNNTTATKGKLSK